MAIRADDLTPTIAPPDQNPKKPRFKPPPLACDSHFHVFGPHSKFPYAPNRTFTPADAPKEDLFRLHEFLGFQRGVFVQSTCHGTDNSVLVDLLTAGQGRYRGSALLEGSGNCRAIVCPEWFIGTRSRATRFEHVMAEQFAARRVEWAQT